MKIEVQPGLYSIIRLNSDDEIPDWFNQISYFNSVTRTHDELSLVCKQELVPITIKAERDWTLFMIVGPIDFSQTGVLKTICDPLADNKISIFILSTFDTSYFLVKKDQVEMTIDVLVTNGFQIQEIVG